MNLELVDLSIEENSAKFSGCVFVSFATEDQKQRVLESADSSLITEVLYSIFFQQSGFKTVPFKDQQIE